MRLGCPADRCFSATRYQGLGSADLISLPLPAWLNSPHFFHRIATLLLLRKANEQRSRRELTVELAVLLLLLMF